MRRYVLPFALLLCCSPLFAAADSGVLVSPIGIAAEGKKTVQIFSDRAFSDVSAVLFDGIPATIVSSTRNMLIVIPPPHAAGTVDVMVTDSVDTRSAAGSFTYFDPAAPPDRHIFEPVLFPIAYNGGGLFGSQWTTENVIGTGRTVVRFREPITVNYCDGTCSQTQWSAAVAAQSDSGVLLWAVRRRLPAGMDDELQVASRVADVSRPRSGGTSLPVAREKDFHSVVGMPGVPLSRGGDRTLLRVYSLDADGAAVHLTFPDGSSADGSVALRLVNGIRYGTLDLTPLQPSGPTRAMVNVTASNGTVWAMVTVTNNATQEVTAIWPR